MSMRSKISNQSKKESGTELRFDRRIRTLKAGRLFSMDGMASLDCVIRDLTNQGARLEFDHPFEGSSMVELQIGLGDLIEGPFECQVQWRRGNQIGLVFNESHDVAPKIL